MNAETMLAIINDWFTYDRERGRLLWKKAVHSSVKIGAEAGCPNGGNYQYRRVSINGKKYLVHRLIWLIETGAWPQYVCDHINRDPRDNRIQNLRDVPQSVNCRNSSRNTSGIGGVHFNSDSGLWLAMHSEHGNAKPIGFFATFGEAVAAKELANAGVLIGANSRKRRSSAVGKALGL